MVGVSETRTEALATKRELYIGADAIDRAAAGCGGKNWSELEIRSVISDGLVSDWDAVEQQWIHAYSVMTVDSSEHPVRVFHGGFRRV